MKKFIVFVFLFLCSSIYVVQAEDEFDINSNSIILIDADTNTVIYEKNSDLISEPLSITKLLTIFLSLDRIDMDTLYEVDNEAIDMTPRVSSHISIDYNEKLSGKDLIYSTAVASANDSSNALALITYGSISAFVDAMNNYAKSLGLYNTSFINPSGLPNDNHYTTARDYATIVREILKDQRMLDIISTSNYEILPTNKKYESRILANTHKMLKGDYYYDKLIGGKTGWDGKENYTLVSYASHNDLNLIVVSMNAKTREGSYKDHKTLLDYGFENFQSLKITKDIFEDTIIETYHRNYISGRATIKLNSDFNLLLPINVTKDDINVKLKVTNEEDVKMLKAILQVYVNDNYVGDVEVDKTYELFDTSFKATTWPKIVRYFSYFSIFILIVSIILFVLKRSKIYKS